MQKMSHREYLVWEAHLRQESWNRPSRSDYYLMKILALLKSWMSGKGVDPQDEKIEFDLVDPDEEETQVPYGRSSFKKPNIQDMDEEEKLELAREISKRRIAAFTARHGGREKGKDQPSSPPQNGNK